jgi:hypothetical protein
VGWLRSKCWWLPLLALLVTACAGLPRDAVTPELVEKASVLDGTQVRYWGDRSPPNMNL